ncbi:uncharacterized protein LOC111321917 [Stylophora pistillata]|uniref:SAP domain-containing protein n=1 Tax=Stylophora pistillata TaxID=50429 RepID=A0A2B4ST86_STYPI|nr:uncharacterized protein LOC111321917 [Stylophora pistillata]PFX31615.1 hypothetical protein AWC38_SpisGene3559 [Stylophora pistillata]
MADENTKVQLVKSDIPGAELPKPAEFCTVAILKRWLSCRGAKVSGNRKDLIKRVNDYINNGLSNNLVDPDGGVNVQKKRLKLGLIQEVNPTCNAEFPADGFQVGISCVPRIGYNHIWKYLIEDVEFKKQLSVEKPIVKGYNFFKSGKVLGLYSKSENGLVYVKSQVQPSYSKGGSVYAVKIFEHETGNKVLKSGFFISDTHPFLGASPDGLVDEDKIVEVKKIVLKEGESLEDGMCRLGIYKRFEQQLVLNNNHKYYYQIQQQLFCAKRSICYFIVSSVRGTHRDTVQFDSAFWENIMPRLESFYFDHVFPELVYPRILTGESRWNKDLQFPRLA